jgi:segregation and condensation protein A
MAFQEVLKKAEMFSTLHFIKEPLSVKERMSEILEKINGNDFVKFEDLFDLDEQRIGLVVTFLAILELMKELLIEVVQAQEFGIIHVKLLVDKETHD